MEVFLLLSRPLELELPQTLASAGVLHTSVSPWPDCSVQALCGTGAQAAWGHHAAVGLLLLPRAPCLGQPLLLKACSGFSCLSFSLSPFLIHLFALTCTSSVCG